MKKYRKMLTDWQASYVMSLLRLIETQSKTTIAHWCINYCEQHLLPVYENAYPDDVRPAGAILAARKWFDGEIKLPAAKAQILQCHAAAREAVSNPAAQAAARAIGQCASTIHAPTHCAALIFYGALALAYAALGCDESWENLVAYAADQCAKMEAALRAVAVQDEPNPAKINWNC